MKYIGILAVAVLLWRGLAPSCAASDCALFQVIVTYQENDVFRPWQPRQPGHRAGYGVVVADGRLLTTEHLVRNARMVELRSPRSTEKIEAVVHVSDPEVNLALLSFGTADSRDGIRPVPLAKRVEREDRMEILQFDETSQTQRGEGRLIQIEMDDIPSAPYRSLAFDLLTDLNMNGEGAPAFIKGRLAALITSYDRARRVAGAIPLITIDRFLARAASTNYAGFPSAGFMWIPLADPAKRSYLGLADKHVGVMVLSCVQGTPAAAALKPNDTIVECDGHTIDNLGYYDDPEFGRIEFTFLLKGRRQCGDTVPMKVVRDRKTIAVALTLQRNNDDSLFIPENPMGDPGEYLISGGFVIRELSGHYIRAHGMDWTRSLDPRIVQLYLTRHSVIHEPGQRVVIASSVLPDQINIGYQHFQNAIVTAVNGEKIANMRDVFRLAGSQGVHSLRIKSIDVDLALDPAEIPSANARLSRTYRIQRLMYQRPAQQ
jgi:S1-C subfamily serine protease